MVVTFPSPGITIFCRKCSLHSSFDVCFIVISIIFPHRITILVVVFLVGDSIHSGDAPFASLHDNTAGVYQISYEETLCHVFSVYPWLIFCDGVDTEQMYTHGSFLESGIHMVVKCRFSLYTFLAHLTRNIVALCNPE